MKVLPPASQDTHEATSSIGMGDIDTEIVLEDFVENERAKAANPGGSESIVTIVFRVHVVSGNGSKQKLSLAFHAPLPCWYDRHNFCKGRLQYLLVCKFIWMQQTQKLQTHVLIHLWLPLFI